MYLFAFWRSQDIVELKDCLTEKNHLTGVFLMQVNLFLTMFSLIILSNTVRSWYWNEYLPNVTDCNEGKDDRINSEQCIKLKESLLQSPIIKVFRFFKSIYHNEYCNHTIHWELVEITKSIWFELNNSKRRVIINST